MLRVLIVDDTNLIRQALTVFFQSEPDVKIVGTAKNGKEAIGKILKFNPHIVLMDMEMPEMDGLTTTTIISEYIRRTKVVILSSYSHQDYIEQALAAGASGYFIKSQPVAELSEAIKLVHGHDVQIIPDSSPTSSYRVILPSLDGVESEPTDLKRINQKPQITTRSNKYAYGNNWSFSSLINDCHQLLAGWKYWMKKSRVSALSLLGMTVFLTTILEYETTVKANAQISHDTEVVTSQTPLVAKALIPAQDIGKIVAEQEVELRVFDCYSTSSCTLKGKTVSIADSRKTPSLQEENGLNPHHAYEVRIEPEGTSLDKNQLPCQLKPGMRARANIITQEATLLAMLLGQMKLDLTQLRL